MATTALYKNPSFRNNVPRYDARSFQHEHKYALCSGVSSRNVCAAHFSNGSHKVLTTGNVSSSHSHKRHLVSSLKKTNIKPLTNHDTLLYNNYLTDIISNNTKHKVTLTLNILHTFIPNYDNAKHSTVRSSPSNAIAYGANTYQGILRNYNEDRVSIIFNMKPPSTLPPSTTWPKVTFFAIYDGHGGSCCSDFLRDHLHTLICHSECFLSNVQQAIYEGFAKAEEMFISSQYKLAKDKSGSCALVAIIVNDRLYVANCGDSRAVMSMRDGKEWKDITVDHKPNEAHEKERIELNGGSVYQSQIALHKDKIMGPYRVVPGRLSVSRTIGDGGAKEEKKGVIIARPDVHEWNLKENDVDFVVMACDGVFDQMSSKEAVDCVWMVFNKGNEDVHDKCGKAVDLIMKGAMARKSLDNVTCIVIALKNVGNSADFVYDSKDEEVRKATATHHHHHIITHNKESIGDNKMLYTNYSTVSHGNTSAKGVNLYSAQINATTPSSVSICNYNRNSRFPLSTLNKNMHTINASSRCMMDNKYTTSSSTHSLKHNYKPPSAVKFNYGSSSNSYNNTLYNTLDSGVSLKRKHDLHLNPDSFNSFSTKSDCNATTIVPSPSPTPTTTINTSQSYKYSYNPNTNYYSHYLYNATPTPLTQRYHSTIHRYNSTIAHSSANIPTIRLNTDDRYNNYFI